MTGVERGYRWLWQLGQMPPQDGRRSTPDEPVPWSSTDAPAGAGPPPRPPTLPPAPTSEPNRTQPVDEDPDTWTLPVVNVEVPSIGGVIHLGEQITTDFHPRDPQRQLGETGTNDEPGIDAPPERSGVAKYAIVGAMIGSGLTNVIDVGRIVKKYPEAWRQGKIGVALGQTLATAPAMPIINPSNLGVDAAVRTGMSFTKWDARLMRTSVFIGSTVSAVQFASAWPNLWDAMQQDGGIDNLLQTTSGRAGVLQLAGGSLGLGMLAAALVSTRHDGGGLVQRLANAGKAPIMANGTWKAIGLLSGFSVMANELGYFRFLDRDNEQSVRDSLREAARRTPVLNSEAWRSVVLVGATAITAKRLAVAVAREGAMAPWPHAPLRAATVAAGLLGMQSVGALEALNAH